MFLHTGSPFGPVPAGRPAATEAARSAPPTRRRPRFCSTWVACWLRFARRLGVYRARLRAGGDRMFSKARLDTLSDGIFGVSMTLLVLDVRLPDNFHPH